MTLSAGPGSDPAAPLDDPDVAPLAVAVGRSLGGILLILLGAAILLGSLYLLFVAPYVGDGWDLFGTLGDVFWIPVAAGLAALLGGVTMVRRAGKKRLEEPAPLTVPTPAEETP